MGNFNIDLCGYKSLWELTAYNVDESSNEFFVPMLATALSSDAVSFKHTCSPLPAVKDVKRMKQTKKCVQNSEGIITIIHIYNCVHVLPIIYIHLLILYV